MRDSIWFQTLSEEQRRLLDEPDQLPKTAEIAIVGAGMIGLASAYYLSAAGVSGICVIDQESALAEASGANAGGIWFGQQIPELGPLSPLAHTASRLYDQLGAQPGWNFDFRRTGLLELLHTEQDWAQAAARITSVHQSGFRAERIDHSQLHLLEPALTAGPAGAIFYPDEAQLHPAKLGAALVRHLKNKSVKFCLHTEVRRAGRCVETTRGEIAAGAMVIAAGAWTPLLTRTLGWTPPIKPMRGQLLATQPQPPIVRHTIAGPRYYYWQLTEGHVAGGGTVEDVGFHRGVDPQDLARIRQEMNTLFPQLHALPTACAWSGFRPYCEDLKPVIGRVPGHSNIYVAAGHFRKGIMLAPVTGKILADLITTGRTDLPIEPLAPARFAGESS